MTPHPPKPASVLTVIGEESLFLRGRHDRALFGARDSDTPRLKGGDSSKWSDPVFSYETYDIDFAAALMAYAGARLVGITPQERQRFSFTFEVDRDQATEIRKAWDAHQFSGNLHTFIGRRRELLKALHAEGGGSAMRAAQAVQRSANGDGGR